MGFLDRFFKKPRRDPEKAIKKAESSEGKAPDPQEDLEGFFRYLEKKSERAAIYEFYGKVIPANREFYEYMESALAPFVYPNQDGDKISISLSALSVIWKKPLKKGSQKVKMPQITLEMIAKSLAEHVEVLKSYDLSKLERTAVQELMEELPPTVADIAKEEPPSLPSENKASEVSSQVSAPQVPAEPVVDEPIEEFEERESAKEKLYSAQTFEEFYRLFAELCERINYEEFFTYHVDNEEIGELYRELFSWRIPDRLILPVVFGLLALDRFGNEVPSVLVKEKSEPTYYASILIPGGSGNAVSYLTQVSLLAHTVSAVRYALKDLKFRIETAEITKDEAVEVLVGLLLHDIGKIPVYRGEIGGKEHAEVGASFLEEAFGLSGSVVNAVRKHHAREIIEDPRVKVEDSKTSETEDKVTKLVRHYDRTERQIELYVLVPVSRLAKVPGAGNTSESDTLYLREWFTRKGIKAESSSGRERPKPQATVSEDKVEEGSNEFDDLKPHIDRFVDFVRKKNVSYEVEGDFYVFKYANVRSVLVPLENKLGSKRARELIVKKGPNVLVSRSLVGEL